MRSFNQAPARVAGHGFVRRPLVKFKSSNMVRYSQAVQRNTYSTRRGELRTPMTGITMGVTSDVGLNWVNTAPRKQRHNVIFNVRSYDINDARFVNPRIAGRVKRIVQLNNARSRILDAQREMSAQYPQLYTQ